MQISAQVIYTNQRTPSRRRAVPGKQMILTVAALHRDDRAFIVSAFTIGKYVLPLL